MRRKSLCISVSHTGFQNFGRKEDPFYILYVYVHYSKAWKTFRVERLKIWWKLLNNKEVLSDSGQRVFMTRHDETCFDLFRLWLGQCIWNKSNCREIAVVIIILPKSKFWFHWKMIWLLILLYRSKHLLARQ